MSPELAVTYPHGNEHQATDLIEINDLISWVRGMPDLVKFELFDALRDELAGSLDPEHPEAR
jgi:hypothetical protein